MCSELLCTICYTSYGFEQFRFSVCGHGFCKDCVQHISNQCPSCRNRVDPRHGWFQIFPPTSSDPQLQSSSELTLNDLEAIADDEYLDPKKSERAVNSLRVVAGNSNQLNDEQISRLFEVADRIELNTAESVEQLVEELQSKDAQIRTLTRDLAKYRKIKQEFKTQRSQIQKLSTDLAQARDYYQEMVQRNRAIHEDFRQYQDRAEEKERHLIEQVNLHKRKAKELGKQAQRRAKLGAEGRPHQDVDDSFVVEPPLLSPMKPQRKRVYDHLS